ncbi:MAG: DUF4129 domain-containing protein [Gemmatimonas sp.]|nr:DUF4129 domain-containing protein [Gemmatimonas sp.]
MKSPSRPQSPWMTSAAVVMLVALVAVASPGAPVWAVFRNGQANRLELLAVIALVAGASIVAGLGVAVFVRRSLSFRELRAMPLWSAVRRGIPWGSVALAALILFTISRTGLDDANDGGPNDEASSILAGEPGPDGMITDDRQGLLAGEDRRVETTVDVGPESSGLDRRLLGSVALAVAIIGAMVLASRTWRSKRREGLAGADDTAEDPAVQEAMEAVTNTIDMMVGDPDPRRAIIGAYARLLEGLSNCGGGRRPHEAPLEHLHRVLNILNVRPEPLRGLAGLFQIARFSTRPLSSADREQALAALRAAARDLAANSPSAQAVASANSIGGRQ